MRNHDVCRQFRSSVVVTVRQSCIAVTIRDTPILTDLHFAARLLRRKLRRNDVRLFVPCGLCPLLCLILCPIIAPSTVPTFVASMLGDAGELVSLQTRVKTFSQEF